MSETSGANRVREILRQAKELAAEYYRLTGKPLGITGEVAEYVAAETLRLELAPPRTKGYDAIRKTSAGNIRVQIKGRAFGETFKRGQRLGTIKTGAPCDQVLLVLLDNGRASVGGADGQGGGKAGRSRLQGPCPRVAGRGRVQEVRRTYLALMERARVFVEGALFRSIGR